jgi:4a-hydroxytetrahydrobiopterin dehydratase
MLSQEEEQVIDEPYPTLHWLKLCVNNLCYTICMDLVQKKCVPCEGGTKPMDTTEISHYLTIVPGWENHESLRISKSFKLNNFKEALTFVNKIGTIAEEEGHHPDINLHNWNRVTVTLTTHAIHGLSLNDFILAAKINAIPRL